MSPSPNHATSIRSRFLIVVATLATTASVNASVVGTASAATPECGPGCISVFSSELGTYTDPAYVEAVLNGGAAEVGQPVGLKPASRLDASEDIVPVPGKVSDFYAKGMVSAAANREYGDLDAVQQRYAPWGMTTDLCVGLAGTARQNLGLTLQRCPAPTTVWIVHPALSPATPGYFPIINATTTDFRHPFAMHLPRSEVVSGRPLQMQVRRLQFLSGERRLPTRQLWGAVFGVLK